MQLFFFLHLPSQAITRYRIYLQQKIFDLRQWADHLYLHHQSGDILKEGRKKKRLKNNSRCKKSCAFFFVSCAFLSMLLAIGWVSEREKMQGEINPERSEASKNDWKSWIFDQSIFYLLRLLLICWQSTKKRRQNKRIFKKKQLKNKSRNVDKTVRDVQEERISWRFNLKYTNEKEYWGKRGERAQIFAWRLHSAAVFQPNLSINKLIKRI